MKWTLIGGVGLMAWLLAAQAQKNDPNAPPELAPKVPKKQSPAAALPGKPLPEESEDAAGQALLLPSLDGLMIVKTQEEIKVEGAPEVKGLKVVGIPLLSGPDFQALVAPYFGRPVRFATVKRLQRQIILYCRAKDRPLVDVILPDQDLTKNAVLQLVFLEGTVGKLTVENPGEVWFKEELIRGQVRLKPGDHIDSKQLLADLDWLNRNPFRQVDVLFKQGQQLGQSDVALQVQDRLPLRVYGGFEDTGTRFTGRDRLLAGFNWGNVFGVDHQLNYQYTTDTDFRLVKAHSVSYLIPLPWRHTLTLFGSYVDGRAEFGSGSTTTAEGKSYQGSLRYSAPLPSLQKYQHEVSAGFDFKRANNDFIFGGTTHIPSDADINQFELGYSALLPDKWGQTSAGIEAYYSPGGLLGNNAASDFNSLRPGSSANYLYARLNAERITRLPYDFSWIVRFQGQLADRKLLPSEELGLGGHSTVRGYDERLVNGDNGWLISNELRTPSLRLGNLLNTPGGADFLQFLTFLDYGATRIYSPQASDPAPDLASVGGGLRFTVSQNLAVRLDYGYQLTEHSLSTRTSRAHVSVLLSY